MKAIVAMLMTGLLTPITALAQDWQAYTYPDPGFTIQFPGAPAVEMGRIKNSTGVLLPITRYVVRQDHVTYTVSVVNYSSTNADALTTITETERSLGASGKVTAAAGARVNRYFGREMRLNGTDGSRSAIAIFFVNKHLYTVVGQALAPSADEKSGDAIHFQESLQFLDDGGGFGGFAGLFGGGRSGGISGGGTPGGAGTGATGGGGGGGGNPGGARPRVSNNAPADATCAGKAAGDAVQLQTPGGPVAATCTLVARPNLPLNGSPDGPLGTPNPVGQQRAVPTP
jgi:hypothetical protein